LGGHPLSQTCSTLSSASILESIAEKPARHYGSCNDTCRNHHRLRAGWGLQSVELPMERKNRRATWEATCNDRRRRIPLGIKTDLLGADLSRYLPFILVPTVQLGRIVQCSVDPKKHQPARAHKSPSANFCVARVYPGLNVMVEEVSGN